MTFYQSPVRWRIVNRTSLGTALSELARRGFRGTSRSEDVGDGTVFAVPDDADPITSEDVYKSTERLAVTALLDVQRTRSPCLAQPRTPLRHEGMVFDVRQHYGWATCTLTEAGFVRLSCNPLVVPNPVTPLDAIAVLERLTRSGSHTFWSLGPVHRTPARNQLALGLQGYRQITDAVLMAAAMQRDGQLATLDAGMEGLVAENETPFPVRNTGVN